MKRPQLAVLIALAASMASAAPVPREWRSRYDGLERVFSTKDIAAIDALLAKNLVWVQWDGTRKNRAETLREFEAMFKSDKVVVREKLLGVTKRGNVVDVSCEVFAIMSSSGRPDARMHSWCVDTWQKQAGRWRLVKTVDSKVELTGG